MLHASTKTLSVAPTTPLTKNQAACSPETGKSATTSEELSRFAEKQNKFVSFDGGVAAQGTLQCPDRYRYWSAENVSGPVISRGAGLSYAAASFGEGVRSVDHKLFNRIVDFHPDARVIEVESGKTLGDLYEFLVGRGLFLATQPGHPRITIGGCIAADIHGKNQSRDGTFINQVMELTLFHPTHGVIRLSPNDEPELFRLTCGGYGLTGNILSARLKLKSIPSPMAEVTLVPVDDITKLPEMLKASAARADFVFSWHDFDSRGSDFGKGFIQEGRFIESNDARNTNLTAGKQTLSAESRGDWKLGIFNRFTVRMINTLYGARAKFASKPIQLSLFDSIFPIQNSKELYFKFFGAAGFYEYQALIPACNFTYFSKSIQLWLQKNDLPLALASVKLFSGRQDLLRFSGDGLCICLDFPRCSTSNEFLQFLDKLMLECRGIPNIIKDSRLPQNVVREAYPQYERFKSQLHQFDPARLYQSELSKRLEL